MGLSFGPSALTNGLAPQNDQVPSWLGGGAGSAWGRGAPPKSQGAPRPARAGPADSRWGWEPKVAMARVPFWACRVVPALPAPAHHGVALHSGSDLINLAFYDLGKYGRIRSFAKQVNFPYKIRKKDV